VNLILATDSYKLTHWLQYPPGTEAVFSYLEARDGATYPQTVFFGLQHLLKPLAGDVVTDHDIDEADRIAHVHFGRDLFNRAGWEHIVDEHNGHLPLRIRAVPEGTVVPVGNVLMTVENTDPKC
jgi:nicotinamide phosphoribosyltransferase